MDVTAKQASKRTWNSPRLRIHGTVEQITHQIPKQFGSDDGLILIVSNPDLTLGPLGS
jgi:hypothetical protein